MSQVAWAPHSAGLCRVPTSSPLAPYAAPLFPTLYCDAAAPDTPYYVVPVYWITAMVAPHFLWP
jgi:hypothetical protein